jgi:hypothetical protein
MILTCDDVIQVLHHLSLSKRVVFSTCNPDRAEHCKNSFPTTLIYQSPACCKTFGTPVGYSWTPTSVASVMPHNSQAPLPFHLSWPRSPHTNPCQIAEDNFKRLAVPLDPGNIRLFNPLPTRLRLLRPNHDTVMANFNSLDSRRGPASS